MKAYIYTRYDSDKREHVLEKKVIVSSKENRWQIMKLNPKEICDWEECNVEFQPERSKREDCKCPVVERWTTGNPPSYIKKEVVCRCGALNPMET